MRLDYTKRFQEINERMDHLKCYYPFFKFYTSSFVRNLGYDVPYLALDVLTLLIENGKLHGRSVRMDEIEIHMENVLKEMYPSQDFDGKEVSKTVLNILETSSSKGEAYHFEYCDPIRKRQVDHYIHLIEYDVNEKAYRITDAGLDFMISIKELPEESKISISLILFKKQIEHGSFLTALNTVRELNLEVVRKKNKKQHLLDKMMYGGLEVVDDFSKFTHEVLHQLKQENELFEQVRHTLRELTENREDIINNPNIKVKEEDFVIIKEISSELENGFTLHSGLIKDYTGLPSEYERIYQIRLNSLFDRKYHFQETLENHIRANLLNDVHVIEMQPMLLPRIPKLFSLFRIFESQSIIREKTEIFEIRLKEDWSEEKLIDDIVDERQLYNFIVYAYVLLESFSNTKEVGLESGRVPDLLNRHSER